MFLIVLLHIPNIHISAMHHIWPSLRSRCMITWSDWTCWCVAAVTDVTPHSWEVRHSSVNGEASVITSPVGSSVLVARSPGVALIFSSSFSPCKTFSGRLTYPRLCCCSHQQCYHYYSRPAVSGMTSWRPTSVLVNTGFNFDLCLYMGITFESEWQTQKKCSVSTVNSLYFKLGHSLMWLLVSNKVI